MPKKATRDGGREQMQRRAEHVAVGRGHLAPGTGYLTVTYALLACPTMSRARGRRRRREDGGRSWKEEGQAG